MFHLAFVKTVTAGDSKFKEKQEKKKKGSQWHHLSPEVCVLLTITFPQQHWVHLESD